MRVADYIFEYLANIGVTHVFMVSGGGAMIINDALGQNKDIKYICCHHEQAAAMAASGYARYSGKLGVVSVTTGCGGVNALTGVLGAYQDHIPLMVISGQCKVQDTIRASGLKLRQLGVQEADVVSMSAPITKYSEMIIDPKKIKYHLDEALYHAFTPPFGPCWIDVPLDVQGALIDETKITTCTHAQEKKYATNIMAELLTLMKKAERPIIVAGQGIRLAGAVKEFKKFVDEKQIPVVFSQLGLDILSTSHPLNLGKIGNKGVRAANFAVQNADLLLVLGSRLSVSSTGLDYHLFAREAKKIVVDVNPIEHQKKTVKIDQFLEIDVKDFLAMVNQGPFWKINPSWVEQCQSWKRKWPVYQEEFSQSTQINLYYFIEMLSQKLKDDSVVVADAGSAMFVTSQGLRISEGQRLILSGGQSEMGFTLPACIGVCFAKGGEVIGITGDGSLQMNIQDLQTIKHHNLPIKLFVWNNQGYLSIRNTQKAYFGRFVGSSPDSGVTFPDLEKIAYAYCITYVKAENSDGLSRAIEITLENTGPVICEVMCSYEQPILTVSSKRLENGKFVSRPLEDMHPFLPRDEFFKEMIVKPIEASYE